MYHYPMVLAHQNRRIAIASGFRVDRAKSPDIPQKEEFRARNRNSKSQIASDFPSHPYIAMQHCFLLSWKSLAISGVRDGHRNRKSQESLRFWCAKPIVWPLPTNSVQQMVSGEFGGGVSRHGLLDTVYPLREHLNSVQSMVSGEYCELLKKT